MLIDSRLEFSNNQIVTGSNPVASTNQLPVPKNLGAGRPVFVIGQLGAAQAAALTISLETADTGAMTGAQSVASVVIPAGSPAGSRFVIGVPLSNKAFVQTKYSGACTVSAWLSDQEPMSWSAHPGVA